MDKVEGRPDGSAGRRRGTARRLARGAAAALSSLMLLAACDVLGLGGGGTFPEPRVYTHQLFATAEECDALRQHGTELNCVEMVTFCPNGIADFLLGGGDIMERGRYTVKGRTVTVRPDHSGPSLRFRLAPDEDTMTRSGVGSVWQRSDETAWCP